jgi:hypothetical protein
VRRWTDVRSLSSGEYLRRKAQQHSERTYVPIEPVVKPVCNFTNFISHHIYLTVHIFRMIG